MSRIASNPVAIPAGVELRLDGANLGAKGPKGELSMAVHPSVVVERQDDALTFAPADAEQSSRALAGTMRALASNMVTGVSRGYEKRLTVVGVGYRVQAQGGKLNLSLGFSHPVVYEAPAGVTIEAPTQTEIVVSGVDKQKVGQVAAEIRAYRPPEPYKGKGVRYADERVVRKQAKKK